MPYRQAEATASILRCWSPLLVPGLWGALYLATRDSAVTVCLPALEDVTSTAGRLVGKATWAFERILGAAMPRAGSLDLIRTAEERWKAQI
jgi:hypothetical protein